ncbi:hypothetical protein L3Q82_021149 [Scortum barcoo]|uniref:Uncharacterized protein n=1 Tax=Scortum barcoo TaxID=214431 RepID=A0ACB8X4A0_9TELE|nr:hypothetical protein L3Q82_021149 [Scortum barcoo]
MFVRLQDCVSDVVVCSTGAPQGTVLSPFLFTLYTSDFTYSTDSCHLQKFSDDTAIVGCVSEGNDCEYRKVIMDFVEWCELNHLQVNASKTKEMVIDFSRKPSSDIAPVNIQGLDIERVRTYKYLGVHLNNKLDWTDNTDSLYKKGQSRLYMLRRLGSFGVCRPLLRTFYETVVVMVCMLSGSCAPCVFLSCVHCLSSATVPSATVPEAEISSATVPSATVPEAKISSATVPETMCRSALLAFFCWRSARPLWVSVWPSSPTTLPEGVRRRRSPEEVRRRPPEKVNRRIDAGPLEGLSPSAGGFLPPAGSLPSPAAKGGSPAAPPAKGGSAFAAVVGRLRDFTFAAIASHQRRFAVGLQRVYAFVSAAVGLPRGSASAAGGIATVPEAYVFASAVGLLRVPAFATIVRPPEGSCLHLPFAAVTGRLRVFIDAAGRQSFHVTIAITSHPKVFASATVRQRVITDAAGHQRRFAVGLRRASAFAVAAGHQKVPAFVFAFAVAAGHQKVPAFVFALQRNSASVFGLPRDPAFVFPAVGLSKGSASAVASIAGRRRVPGFAVAAGRRRGSDPTIFAAPCSVSSPEGSAYAISCQLRASAPIAGPLTALGAHSCLMLVGQHAYPPGRPPEGFCSDSAPDLHFPRLVLPNPSSKPPPPIPNPSSAHPPPSLLRLFGLSWGHLEAVP